MPEISLNGNQYVTRGRIQRRSQEPFATAFRTIGLQRREDIQGKSSFVFPVPLAGFGLSRIRDINDPLQVLRIWDSRMETRFGSGLYLPILAEQSTETGLEVIRASVVFKGNLWAIWDDDTSTDIVARKYSPAADPDWTGGGPVKADITYFDTIVGQDILAHKTHLIACVAYQTAYQIHRSTDGITWVIATTVPAGFGSTLSNNIAVHEDIDGALLSEIGGEAVVALWDEVGGTITFGSSADAGNVWVDEGVDIPSGNGPQGIAVLQGIDAADKLYVMTREGLWEVDTAPATWTMQLILPLPAHNDNGRRMTVHQGKLWFSVGVDDSTPAPIYTMEVRGDVRDFRFDQGLDVDDGVPTEILGPVNWMTSAGRFLFISVGGGAASRNSRILCHNGFGWHFMYRNATANEEIQWIAFSADDDGIPRLHFALRTAAATSDTQFLGQPLVNPHTGVTIQRAATGLLDRPEFDGGMPRDACAWLELFYDAIDLSATNSDEYINADYGLEGAVPTTDLGDFLSGTKALPFGTNGVGVSGTSIQIRENFHRNTQANSPVGRSLQLTYLKQPAKSEAWAVTIDLAATADLHTEDVEDIIARLEAAEDSVLLVEFQYGKLSTKYVHVEPVNWDEVLDEPQNPMNQEEREGFAVVTLREVR